MIELSIVVCTFNRIKDLTDTLDSLLNQKECPYEYKIIVVDNDSSDNTAEIVNDYIYKYGRHVRYVLETRRGVSFARNRGISESEGNIIAFADDDCIVDDRWINNIMQTFKKYKVDCVGGKILPLWGGTKPEWLVEQLYGRLALNDYGNDPITITKENGSVFTANAAFSKHLFDLYGGFQQNIIRGEDSAYIDMLLTHNIDIIHQPDIVVHHKIPKERLTKQYFIKWHRESGLACADTISYEKVKNILFGIPRYRIRKSIVTLMSYIYSLLFKKKEAFYYRCCLIADISFYMRKIRNFAFNKNA